ncbi:MAG: AbrB/MazE/SpoVT family DNA-binding domain-containing protein [Xanthobacteraceae bacterium]
MTAHKKISADPQHVGSVTLKKIGNSTGFILPKEMMARLNIATGDTFYATVTPEGGIRLNPYDPKFEEAMNTARRGMKIYRNALAELAK